MLEQIQALLNDEALRKALTHDAYQSFAKTLKEAQELHVTIKQLTERKVELEAKVSQLSADNTLLRQNDQAVTAREKAVAEREKKMTELELNAKHQAERVNDHKEMVKLIFRNTEIKRNYSTSGYGNNTSTSDSGSETIERT